MGGSWPRKKHYLQHVYTSQLGDIMWSSDFWTIFGSFGNSAVVPSANSDRIFSIENDNKQLMLVVKQEIPRIGNHPHFCWDPLDLQPAKGGWRKKTTNNISHSYQMPSFGGFLMVGNHSTKTKCPSVFRWDKFFMRPGGSIQKDTNPLGRHPGEWLLR